MGSVLAGQPDLAAERKVVADEDGRADDQAGGEAAAVRIPDADDQAEVLGVLAVGDLQQPEGAVAVAGQAVYLADDAQGGALQGGLDAGEQPVVRSGAATSTP